ncbi:MAG: rhomboid family intramembrane serine protease [Alphaproteobacteria bacterium]|nr:MAG: rhomboid family intramembrane serine protease [Alphaproteobacteria bacterium]
MAMLKRLLWLLWLLGAIWAVELANLLSDYWFNRQFGLIPREIVGLDGILAMPLLHGSVDHALTNTPPLIVLGGLLGLTASRSLLAINAMIVAVGGGLVWLLGRAALHVGASGLIFGWFAFLVARGIIDRSPLTLAIAALAGALYGTIILGVLPGQPGVSWEAHLFGAVAGVLAALLLPVRVHDPRRR